MAKLKSTFDALDPSIQKKLQDLSSSLKEVTIDKDGWCYKYRDRKEIGNAIYKDFLAYNAEKMGKANVFSFSEELVSSGILSQLQGFQVLAILIEDFDAPLDTDKLLAILDDILNTVGDADKNRFDATPYLPDCHQFDTDNYIDSVTWFASCALSVFRLIIQKNFQIGEARMERLVRLYRYSIDYIIHSFIETNKEDTFGIGWNYTADCKEPSLYFTYAVSEVLIDIYSTFQNVIITAETELVQQEIEDTFSTIQKTDEIRLEISQKIQQIEDINEIYIAKFRSETDSIAKEKQIFTLINGGYAVFDNASPYRIFEEQCKKAANCIWNIVKDKLTNRFFSSDLVNDISDEVIEQSITSDSLFNSIFAINAVVNAGLDEDAEDKINYFTLNGSPEYEKAIDDYDEMRDTLRLGYDNVYQMYSKLSKKGKEYKVNEYLLSFAENFKDSQIENVKEIRKARIRVFSLMPLLVKTKTSLGQFVIRYPQYDMQLYLEQILERRFVTSAGETLWIWEKDGYSSSSNYYYLSALSDFFQYYEDYELTYSQNAYKNEQQKKRIREKYLEELKSESGAIGQLEHHLKVEKELTEKLRSEILTLTEKINKLNDDPLRKALNEFIYAAIQERIVSLLSDMFTDMAQGITADAKERAVNKGTSSAGEHTEFERSVRSLGMSLISEQILEILYDDKDVKNIDKDLLNLENKTSLDLKNLLRLYIRQVMMGGSDFVLTKGYRGLRDLLQSEQQRKNEQKNKRD